MRTTLPPETSTGMWVPGSDELGSPMNHLLQRGEAKIGGAAIRWTTESSVHSISDKPKVLILGGLFSDEENYVGLRHELANLDIEATTIKTPTKQNLISRLHKSQWDIMQLQSQAPYGVMKEVDKAHGRPDSRFVVVGHSLGVFKAAVLAAEKPHRIQRLVALAGSGMDKHTLPQMAGRTVGFFRRNAIPAAWRRFNQDLSHEKPSHALAKDARYVAGFVLRTGLNIERRAREVNAAATRETVPYLFIASKHGVPIEVVAFRDDPYSSRSENEYTSALLGADFHYWEGTHLAPQEEPAQVAAGIKKLILPQSYRPKSPKNSPELSKAA